MGVAKRAICQSDFFGLEFCLVQKSVQAAGLYYAGLYYAGRHLISFITDETRKNSKQEYILL